MIDRTPIMIPKPERFQAQVYPVYQFQAPDGSPLLTIWPDGRAELGPGISQDAASRAFWAYLIATNPILARPCPGCGEPMTLICNNLCNF